ncbi:hypothetical protein DERF_008374 [Dermatophagoides farinae]|uniref:Uncharacterized protein n=1 Tax=Dermatophagoides farinae TaxID=6954 RepID=A0A922L5E9_DERFA|nr:hypothetical protein DERF_008374 [Dermatophagoides farinae]
MNGWLWLFIQKKIDEDQNKKKQIQFELIMRCIDASVPESSSSSLCVICLVKTVLLTFVFKKINIHMCCTVLISY